MNEMQARHCREALERCGANHTLADVEQALASGQVKLWAGERATVVTEQVEYPNGSACLIWLAGGDLAELLRIYQDIEGWAAVQGCRQIQIIGRPGWRRVLPGYRQTAVVLQKELPHG